MLDKIKGIKISDKEQTSFAELQLRSRTGRLGSVPGVIFAELQLRSHGVGAGRGLR